MALKRRLWRLLGVFLIALFAIGITRWLQAVVDLNRPARLTAWQQMQRAGNPDYVVWERVTRGGREVMLPRFNPNAAMLWLAMGRDPGGNDCAKKGQRPSAFALAILRPLGACKPHDSSQMPFIHVVLHGFSPEAREVAKLMIAAGADVNEISPDGIVPLRSAALRENEEMVRLLLTAGADPFLKPQYNQIGDFSSAWETAERLPKSSVTDRIREAMRFAVEQRGNASGNPGNQNRK